MKRFWNCTLIILMFTLLMAGVGWGDTWHPRSGTSLGLSLSAGGGGFISYAGTSFTQQSYADYVTSLSSTGCTVEDLGASSDGSNHLWGLKYGTAGKPVIFITGCQHGNEWWSAYTVKQFMSNLVSPTEGSNVAIANLLSNFQFYAIPCVNPYGYINNNRGNANGVDINRNYNFNWAAYDDSGDAPLTKGASAESEAETQIVAKKIELLAPIAVIDIHNGYADYDYACEYSINSNEKIITDIFDSLESILSNENRLPATVNQPLSFMYARSILSFQNRYPISFIFEIGSEVAKTNSKNTLNCLLKACQGLVTWKTAGYPVTIQPTEALASDTQIYKTAPTYNYGIAASIGAGTSTANEPRRGLISFPLTYLVRSYAGITSGLLSLYLDSEEATADKNVSAYRALTQWYEGAEAAGAPGAGVDGSTWNERNANGSVAWGVAGGLADTDYSSTPTATTAITGPTGQYYSWEVGTDVQLFSFGTTNYGWWLINADETSASTRKTFQSSGHTNKPKLYLTFPTRTTWDHEWNFASALTDNPATGHSAVNLTHSDTAVYTTDNDGRRSNALVLDGSTDNAKNTTPGTDITSLGSTFTIILEFNPSSVTVSHHYLLSLSNVATIGYALYISLDDSKLNWHNGTLSGPVSGVLTAGTPYKFVMVQSGGTLTTYINGTQVYSGSVAAPANQTEFKFVVGDRDSNDRKFAGTISRIAILKGTALTPAQVRAE